MKPWEVRSLVPRRRAEIIASYEAEQVIDGYYKNEEARVTYLMRKDSESKSSNSGRRRPGFNKGSSLL